MSTIADIAAALVVAARTEPAREEKTAAAQSAHEPSLEVTSAIRKLAAALRASPDATVSLEDVKVAFDKSATFAQRGTAAQAPNAGGGVGMAQPVPTLPALQTTNLGVTAGAGGAPSTMKAASESSPISSGLRTLAAHLRTEERAFQEKVAQDANSILKAATGLRYLQQGIAP